MLGHADLIKKETLQKIRKNYPDIKIAQWFLDRMDREWKNNKKRFLDKIDFVDCSFCTTSPDILNFPKNKKFFIYLTHQMSLLKISIFIKKNILKTMFFLQCHMVFIEEF